MDSKVIASAGFEGKVKFVKEIGGLMSHSTIKLDQPAGPRIRVQ